MTLVKLTKNAQDIVNQIMSADAVDVDHGPVGERIAYGNMNLTGEGLEFNVDIDGDPGEMTISNEALNTANIVNGVIVIDSNNVKNNHYGDITITLYKLNKINAVYTFFK
jgi:hypothetical protein